MTRLFLVRLAFVRGISLASWLLPHRQEPRDEGTNYVLLVAVATGRGLSLPSTICPKARIAGLEPPVNAGVMTTRRYRFRLRLRPSMRAMLSAAAAWASSVNPMAVPVLSRASVQAVLPSADS